MGFSNPGYSHSRHRVSYPTWHLPDVANTATHEVTWVIVGYTYIPCTSNPKVPACVLPCLSKMPRWFAHRMKSEALLEETVPTAPCDGGVRSFAATPEKRLGIFLEVFPHVRHRHTCYPVDNREPCIRKRTIIYCRSAQTSDDTCPGQVRLLQTTAGHSSRLTSA